MSRGSLFDRHREPMDIAELELSGGEPPTIRRPTMLLVRSSGVPVADLRVTPSELAGTELPELVDARLADQPLPEPAPASDRFVSVVIATLGRSRLLADTVRTILAGSHRELELIVVDNGCDGRVPSALADIDDDRLRIVPEARRGSSRARNAGAAVAGGDVIIFTDDDMQADPNWVRSLITPFDENAHVVCVTGITLPGELRSPAQLIMNEFGGFDKGLQRKVFALGPTSVALGVRHDEDPLFPYNPGAYAPSANIAVRAAWLDGTPPFDTRLGIGPPTGGGEDLDLCLRAVLSGGVLIYEPRALLRHFGHTAESAVRRQMFSYGMGLTAVITKYLLTARHGREILRRVPIGLSRLRSPDSDKNQHRSADYPRVLVRLELLGMALGPINYLRSRWSTKYRP